MVVALVVLEIEGLAQRANPRHVTSAQKPGLVRVKRIDAKSNISFGKGLKVGLTSDID